MTEIVSVHDILRVKKVLKSGGVIIYPTETSYGIGCDATNMKATNSIYDIKKRSRNKNLIILVSSIKMAEKYLKMNEISRKLARKFMPGALTLICDNKPSPIIKGRSEVSFRISPNNFVKDLLNDYSKPITSTSANRAGKEALYSFKDVLKEFYGEVDLIVDAGKLKKNKLSTVFDTRSLEILRKGPVSKKDIMKVIN